MNFSLTTSGRCATACAILRSRSDADHQSLLGARRVPSELVPKMAELGLAGGTSRATAVPACPAWPSGCWPRNSPAPTARICTFFGVTSGLAMGSYLRIAARRSSAGGCPAMSELEKIGAFALTEPLDRLRGRPYPHSRLSVGRHLRTQWRETLDRQRQLRRRSRRMGARRRKRGR